jgi:hypothetical protein
MVLESVNEREKTSKAVLETVRGFADKEAYADDVAEVLQAGGIELEKTLWTVWRLIDENRLFLDHSGHLVLERPEPAE